jgi:hypothetical protein
LERAGQGVGRRIMVGAKGEQDAVRK